MSRWKLQGLTIHVLYLSAQDIYFYKIWKINVATLYIKFMKPIFKLCKYNSSYNIIMCFSILFIAYCEERKKHTKKQMEYLPPLLSPPPQKKLKNGWFLTNSTDNIINKWCHVHFLVPIVCLPTNWPSWSSSIIRHLFTVTQRLLVHQYYSGLSSTGVDNGRELWEQYCLILYLIRLQGEMARKCPGLSKICVCEVNLIKKRGKDTWCCLVEIILDVLSVFLGVNDILESKWINK